MNRVGCAAGSRVAWRKHHEYRARLAAAPPDPTFVFYCKGRAPVVLTLDKFVADFRALPRTTSHRMWAQSFGLDQGDRLVVHTAEGRDFLIDARTGKLLKGSYAH